MNRYLTGYQVSLNRQDVPILADPRDLTSAFEVPQRSAQGDSRPAAYAKFPSDLDLVQRPVIFPGQERENLFSNLGFVYAHFRRNNMLRFVDLARFQSEV